MRYHSIRRDIKILQDFANIQRVKKHQTLWLMLQYDVRKMEMM